MAQTHIVAESLDGKTYTLPTSDLTWRPAAYGVVIKDGKVLLLPQDGKGYVLPGGGMEVDELSEAAVLREVREETGLTVEVKKFLDLRENYFVIEPETAPEDVWHSLCLYYLCVPISGELSTAGFDEFEQAHVGLAEWVDIRDFATIPIVSSIDFKPIVLQAIKELT